MNTKYASKKKNSNACLLLQNTNMHVYFFFLPLAGGCFKFVQFEIIDVDISSVYIIAYK